MKRCIKINQRDNTVIALFDLKSGEVLDEHGIVLLEKIKKGHKVAIREIRSGENVIKYGLPIGHATTAIKPGQWVHTHNAKTNLSYLDNYSYTPEYRQLQVKLPNKRVNIYRRKDGKVAIRNELWIVPTVGCVNATAKLIMKEFIRECDLAAINGVNVLTHNYGCSQSGDDHENTKTILQNVVKHPNAGGVLVLGLGCENNQLDTFRDSLGEYEHDRVEFLVAQEVDDEIDVGKQLLKKLLKNMENDRREEGLISDLRFGLECGGSDGLSGITANPMLGEFSDYITSFGGTTVITEVPEMFGAEALLMCRCADRNIFNKTVTLINDFKSYIKQYGHEIYENPSPGNKEGGITTLEDKSLGCTQKSGSSRVMDVLKYGEIIGQSGLNLLSAPGNDLIATTALAASGCHMVLFTTGRGNPYGGFVPTVKISTNTELAKRKKRWIDFDAGRLISSEMDMDDLLEEFVEYVVKVVNGQECNNEANGFKELAIFKSGVTL